MIIKLGEAQAIQLESTETCSLEMDAAMLESFRKTAADLKKIAPKAEDFLYFSATIIHAAEASAINDDGTPKLNLQGEPVKVGWDSSNNGYKWVSNDPNIKPYKNSNSDIFPEVELIKAYKKWQHKPLCIDHKSSSVDHVRGFIVDTYYDRSLKRVVALCALDKIAFPTLARQISTGVSNNVSMGVGVGRAVCYDCGRVARAEQDFCHHMKTKSSYGEINLDLNPIELSIVVNGADPKAKIKHIIAAANTMNSYLDNRAQELQKMAINYTANITVNNGTDSISNDRSEQLNFNATDLAGFKAEMEKAFQKLEEFKASEKELHVSPDQDGNNAAFNQSASHIAMDESAPVEGMSPQTPQQPRLASEKSLLDELHKVNAAIETKLDIINGSIQALASISHSQNPSNKDNNMTGSKELNKAAYFQGGGGVNEPTPGQVKYPKDPMNEDLRLHDDKQMVGQSPFPGVGPVDGMHPSPSSVDPSNELERKKMLARAEAEEKAIRRNAIVQMAKEALENKKAYFQGGGGPNEPTPGKPKYPKDPLNEEDREHEDKQMVGQPPFPGVGKVDGLHPSPASVKEKDELERKKMLARASYRARFVKAANVDGSYDKAKSAWEVFMGDKLLLKASVKDLSGGNSDMLYDNIATKEFGAKLIENVKTKGADVVSKTFKTAQVAPAAPAAPADPMAGSSAPAQDEGKDGDPKETVVELADKVRDLSSDLAEAAHSLTGEQAEMGADTGGAASITAPGMAADDDGKFSTAAIKSLRKELNADLAQAIKQAAAELNSNLEELQMITSIYDGGSVRDDNQENFSNVVSETVRETQASLEDGFKLMAAFVNYSRGTDALVKRASLEDELRALAEKGDDDMDTNTSNDGDLMGLMTDTNADLDDLHGLMGRHEEGGGLDGVPEDDGFRSLLDEPSDHDEEDDDREPGDGEHEDTREYGDEEDMNDVSIELPAGAKIPEGMDGAKLTMASKQGRQLLRAKLAADALGKEDSGEVTDMSKQKFSDMLNEADRLADGQTHLDVKPSENLGRVETLPEINKRMLEVAKAPPKVRKDAAALQQLIAEGKLDRNDVEALVAHGVDKDTVAYWKKYYGEVDGGSEFASELLKEHVKAQMEEQIKTFQVKLARAYELTYDMIDRGLCSRDRGSVSEQVDQFMQCNNEAFDSFKKVIARHETVVNSRFPQVGLFSQDEDVMPQVRKNASNDTLFEDISSLLGQRKGNF